MLQRILKKTNKDKRIFPIQENVPEDLTLDKNIKDYLQYLVLQLSTNKDFLLAIEEIVTQNLLGILLTKYDFEPTDKYKEEIENKKKYVNQLDAYLDERKEINLTVKNDLQQFLNETRSNITMALESFSQGIQLRIAQAESDHGIDKIKQVLNHKEL